MMKKLLILMLVFGMASAAYAELSLSVSQPSSASLNVEVTGTIDFDLYIVLSSNGTTALSSYALGTGAPDFGMYQGPTSDLVSSGLWTEPAGFAGQYWVMAASDNSVYSLTGQFMTATGGSIGDQVNVQAFDEVTGFLGNFGTITLIPEPMTVLLLGLGGLFLRRRKK